MPQASTNVSFKRNQMANPEGIDTVNGQAITVEVLTADPTDLTTNFPRCWINVTTGIMKFTVNGTTIKSVTAT